MECDLNVLSVLAMAQEDLFGQLVFTTETKSLTKNATADNFYTLENGIVSSITDKGVWFAGAFVDEFFTTKFRLAGPDEYDFIEDKKLKFAEQLAKILEGKAQLETLQDKIEEQLSDIDKWLASKNAI